jgi:hypothetical protein
VPTARKHSEQGARAQSHRLYASKCLHAGLRKRVTAKFFNDSLADLYFDQAIEQQMTVQFGSMNSGFWP